MSLISGEWYLPYLRCPDCRDMLDVNPAISCDSCGFQSDGDRDLRPKHPSFLNIQMARTRSMNLQERLQAINTATPPINFSGPSARRDSRVFMIQLAERFPKGGKVLDLGCGPRDQASPLEWLGFNYIGVDYSSKEADFLADAHSLPFADETFDCVFSYAVLEHLHNPFIAIQEIARVLKPGGTFLGTVSQGEPFHDSYFHHTPWGVISLFEDIGDFRVDRLWGSMDTLQSLSRIGRYPRVIKFALHMIETLNRRLPFLAPRRMKWSKKEKEIDFLYKDGSIGFLSTKRLKS